MYPHPVFARQLPRADVSNIIATTLGRIFATANGPALHDIALPAALTLPLTVQTPAEQEQATLTAMKSRWNEWLPLHLLPIEVFIEILLYVDRRENIVKRNRTLSLVCKFWRSVVSGCPDFWAQVRFNDKPQFIRTVVARRPFSGITVVCDLPHDDEPESPIGGAFHLDEYHHIQPWMPNEPWDPNLAAVLNALGLGGGPGITPDTGQEEVAWREALNIMQGDPKQRTIDSRNSFFFDVTLGATVRSFKFRASLSPFRRQYIYKMSRKATNELEIRSAEDSKRTHDDKPIKLARRCQAEHLIIRDVVIRWDNTSFTQLHSLRFHGLAGFPPSTSKLRDILCSCPSLEWIVLQNVNDKRTVNAPTDAVPEAISPVTLPHLRSLLIMKSSSRFQSLFLHNLVAPKLTYVCSEFLTPEDFHSESFLQLLEGPLRAAADAADVMDVSYEDFYQYLCIGIKNRHAGGWSPLTDVWEGTRPGIELTAQVSDTSAWLPLEQFISNQDGRLASISFESSSSSHHTDPNPQPRWFFQDPAQLSFLRQWTSVTHLSLRDKTLAEILLRYLSTAYYTSDGQLLVPLPHLTELGLFGGEYYDRVSACLSERSRTAPVAAISRIFCCPLPPTNVKQMEYFKNVEFEECRSLGRWASLPSNIADDLRYI